jgi:class 3 adenylate cyclase
MEGRMRERVRRLPGWLRRLMAVGAQPEDDDDLRVRKALLVLSASLMASLATLWVVTYAALGLWVSAAIPFAYQVASVASIAVFARTRRWAAFRESQLAMSLVFPFLLQWSLGGFEASSAVSLWGVTSPLGALLFAGTRRSVPWFAAFAALLGVSAAIDPALSDAPADVPDGIVTVFFALNILGVSLTAYALLQYFVRERERAQERSERLLLNVLPAPIALRLKDGERVIADAHPEVTVLFADLVGFTPLARRLPAHELVALLDQVFAAWDALALEHGAEKIKTIGDAYMVACGVPVARPDHAEAVARMALAMGPAVAAAARAAEVTLQVRIGIDSGPAVAGVIGRSKFTYDLWGETVNTASRMESHAPVGAIQVSERAHERLREGFTLERRGVVDVKGIGPLRTWLLTGLRGTP